jgi:hypothetical protein
MENDESPMAVVVRHQKAPPVRPSAIAADLGIVILRISLGPHIAGQLRRDPIKGGTSGFIIFVNMDDHINRQRFTAAHEIAHFILHRDLIEDGVIDDTMYRSDLPGPYETQANQLAADILMPIRLIKKCRQTNPDLDYIQLAKMFGVSQEAMKIRLQTIRLSPPHQP